MVADDVLDPQRSAVYLAEELASDAFADTELGDVPADELAEFAARTLTAAGWTFNRPTFVLDVPDHADWSGWHEGATGAIHLHPRLLSPDTILHELAHWVDPRGGHGPRFCSDHVELVRAGIGDEYAEVLLAAYRDFGALR